MFYENLLKLCSANRTTPTAVAKELGLSSGAPTFWKNGSVPRASTLQKIADHFGVDVKELISDAPDPASTLRVDHREYGRVRIYSQVAAGTPIEAIDVFDPDDPDDWSELEKNLADTNEYFGLRVHGTSMMPDFHEGDIVIVHKQDYAREGDIVVVTEERNWGTVKKIHYRSDGITLYPLNPDFEPIRYSADQCRTLPVRIEGKVVRLHRDY